MIVRNGKPGAPLVPRCQVFPFRSIPLLLRRAGLDPLAGSRKGGPVGLVLTSFEAAGHGSVGVREPVGGAARGAAPASPDPEPTAAEPAPRVRGAGGRPVAVEPRTRRVSMSLTEAEQIAYARLRDEGGVRLEQERIPWEVALDALRQAAVVASATSGEGVARPGEQRWVDL